VLKFALLTSVQELNFYPTKLQQFPEALFQFTGCLDAQALLVMEVHLTFRVQLSVCIIGWNAGTNAFFYE